MCIALITEDIVIEKICGHTALIVVQLSIHYFKSYFLKYMDANE